MLRTLVTKKNEVTFDFCLGMEPWIYLLGVFYLFFDRDLGGFSSSDFAFLGT